MNVTTCPSCTSARVESPLPPSPLAPDSGRVIIPCHSLKNELEACHADQEVQVGEAWQCGCVSSAFGSHTCPRSCPTSMHFNSGYGDFATTASMELLPPDPRYFPEILAARKFQRPCMPGACRALSSYPEYTHFCTTQHLDGDERLVRFAR